MSSLSNAVLENVDLEFVNFTNADWRNVGFSSSVMVDANFYGAGIRGANLANKNTRGCIRLYLDCD
jgi:uncharacterized protein YjbI with pentapeptide repeats